MYSFYIYVYIHIYITSVIYISKIRFVSRFHVCTSSKRIDNADDGEGLNTFHEQIEETFFHMRFTYNY